MRGKIAYCYTRAESEVKPNFALCDVDSLIATFILNYLRYDRRELMFGLVFEIHLEKKTAILYEL